MSQSFVEAKVNPDRGFLPPQDPLKQLPAPFKAWEEVARQLPKLMASDQLRRTIVDLPPFPRNEIHDHRETRASHGFCSAISDMPTSGEGSARDDPAADLPCPGTDVAESLGRPPVLSYSSYALHNYFRFDATREIECGNIGPDPELSRRHRRGMVHPDSRRDRAESRARRWPSCTPVSMPRKRATQSDLKPCSTQVGIIAALHARHAAANAGMVRSVYLLPPRPSLHSWLEESSRSSRRRDLRGRPGLRRAAPSSSAAKPALRARSSRRSMRCSAWNTRRTPSELISRRCAPTCPRRIVHSSSRWNDADSVRAVCPERPAGER